MRYKARNRRIYVNMQLQCNSDILLPHFSEVPPMQNTHYLHKFNNYIYPNTLHKYQLGSTLFYYNLILGTVSRQARVTHVPKQRKSNQLMKCPKLLTAGLAFFTYLYRYRLATSRKWVTSFMRSTLKYGKNSLLL